MPAKPKFYENYPFWMILLSNLVSFAIYLIGGYIIYQVGFMWLITYIVYILFLELKLMKNCTNCYYYGKYCAFGMGKLSAVFFKRGDNKKFCKREIGWKDLLPDLLISVIPFIVGIVLLIIHFDFFVLLLVIILFILTSTGNSLVRGKCACKYCKQRELGCPAENLFKKGKKK
jgi:hypothetical protein